MRADKIEIGLGIKVLIETQQVVRNLHRNIYFVLLIPPLLIRYKSPK
jgi:hypothetical protein